MGESVELAERFVHLSGELDTVVSDEGARNEGELELGRTKDEVADLLAPGAQTRHERWVRPINSYTRETMEFAIRRYG